jgi:hypothetical protein
MATPVPSTDNRRADFGDLREAYMLLADILSAGGVVEKQGKGLSFRGIPRGIAADVRRRLKGCEHALAALVGGFGEKKALDGQDEVVLAAIGRPSVQGDATDPARRAIDVCALRVRARGPIVDGLVVSTDQDDWKKRLVGFVDWSTVSGVLCAADGNNQRAAIGAVLACAGIGRGTLSLVEMEVPQEIDESTHLVRGAEWMNAALPRFYSAASEALWYLIRARSLHSRMFRERKQGFYTSMAILAAVATGADDTAIAAGYGLPVGLVGKMADPGEGKPLSRDEGVFVAREIFEAMPSALDNERSRTAAGRVWRGPAVYLRGMDWRQSVSRKARARLAEGGDLVEIAEDLKIQRRELVRILSQGLADGDKERERFRAAVPKPEAFAALLGV